MTDAKANRQASPPPASPAGAPVSCVQARRVADAAAEAAAKIGVPNAIAVVEPSGDLIHFLRMDGAPYSSIDLAQQKASTSARYRRPTKFFFDSIEKGHSFFLTFPGVVAAPGGIPLVLDGKLIGALGVSGGNGDQDVAVAEAGVAALLLGPNSRAPR